MSLTLTSEFHLQPYQPEGNDRLPAPVARLLGSPEGPGREAAWEAFVEQYSRLLLRVAFRFAQGYDGAMDRYAFMLDQLRRNDYARLRKFAADGRSRFSTWLVVVARRLCLDHHRQRYGRVRRVGMGGERLGVARAARRRLADLAGGLDDLPSLADPAAPDPVERLSDLERREALARAVGLLEPRDQLLLRLRFDEDLSAREITDLMGLPTPFHVYRRLRSLCEFLRLQIDPLPQGEGHRRVGT